MEISEEAMNIALEIINELLQNQEISKIKNMALYNEYVNNTEIENITNKIAEKMGFEIYHMERTLNLCVMPENKVFGYTNEDLKNRIKQFNRNEDIYLMYFVIITLITCFYKESGFNTPRTYLRFDEFIETIHHKFENLILEELEESSKKMQYNFVMIKKVWERLADAKEERVGVSKNDKISFVRLVLKFLQEEKLVFYDENTRNIYITTRFKSIVYFYFEYDKNNKNNLMGYIYQLGGEEDATY